MSSRGPGARLQVLALESRCQVQGKLRAQGKGALTTALFGLAQELRKFVFLVLTFWAGATVPRKNRPPPLGTWSQPCGCSTDSLLWGLEAAFPDPGGNGESLASQPKLTPQACHPLLVSLPPASLALIRGAPRVSKESKIPLHWELVYPLRCRQVSYLMGGGFEGWWRLCAPPPAPHCSKLNKADVRSPPGY